MSRRTVLTSFIEEQLAAANSRSSNAPKPTDRVLAGPVRAMSLTLDKLEEESRALQQALAEGAAVVAIDPGAIESSFVTDRFEAVDDVAFAALTESIRDHGQEVPILVRPHPEIEGRYQAAYGHRRLRAARALGMKVKAVVRTLDDMQLVVAQGVENSARRDLSFIERAMFAKGLEDRRFERPVIMAALSTDKTELSKLLAVAHAAPEPLIRAIGPAPKAGRRRWMELVEALQGKGALRRAELALADPNLSADTDVRFLRVLAAAIDKAPAGRRPNLFKTPEGATLARISRDKQGMTLRIDAKAEPDFGDYVAGRLTDLLQEFRSQRA